MRTFEKHYIVNYNNYIDCQIEFLEKGFKWRNWTKTKIFNIFSVRKDIPKNEILVIHLYENESVKEISWDVYDMIKNNHNMKFEIYESKRLKKLKRILNE